MSISSRPLADREFDLGEPQLQRREAGGKGGGDRGDRNAGAFERPDRRLDHRRIDADRADRRRVVGEAERGDEFVVERPARLGAQAAHAARRVVAGERRQVEAGQRAHQPRGLVVLLDRAASGQARGAALDGAGVDGDRLEPRRFERDAGVAQTIVARRGGRRRDLARLVQDRPPCRDLGAQSVDITASPALRALDRHKPNG